MRLARFGDRVTLREADLGLPLPVAEPADALLSTATFHWVLDQDGLPGRLAAALRPGGQLVAQQARDWAQFAIAQLGLPGLFLGLLSLLVFGRLSRLLLLPTGGT